MDDDSGRTTAVRDWRHRARCRSEDPDTLFVQGAQQRDVREVCKACPVRTECLAHALDNRIRFGVWGGMTERERARCSSAGPTSCRGRPCSRRPAARRCGPGSGPGRRRRPAG